MANQANYAIMVSDILSKGASESTMFFQLPNVSKTEAKMQNVQVLAFVGDSVHTLYVKSVVTLSATTKSGGLHKLANQYVNAKAQSLVAHHLQTVFTEEEMDIFKRGRNYKTQSLPKNANVVDYKNATGLEAVFGYLYVTNQTERLEELLKTSMELVEKQNEN